MTSPTAQSQDATDKLCVQIRQELPSAQTFANTLMTALFDTPAGVALHAKTEGVVSA